MRRKLLLVPAALLTMTLLSSCFVFIGISLGKHRLQPGESTIATIKVRPQQADLEQSDFVFILIGLPDDGDITAPWAKWDVPDKFAGAHTMIVDATLNTFINTNDICDDGGFDQDGAASTTWKLFRTNIQVNDLDAPGRVTDIRVKLQVASSGIGSENYNPRFMVGAWNDDGDGVPEDNGVEVMCTGGGSPALNIIT